MDVVMSDTTACLPDMHATPTMHVDRRRLQEGHNGTVVEEGLFFTSANLLYLSAPRTGTPFCVMSELITSNLAHREFQLLICAQMLQRLRILCLSPNYPKPCVR
jgi:hypothetical protein